MRLLNVLLTLVVMTLSFPAYAEWPKTTDELLGMKTITFKYGSVSGKVDLVEKTYVVYTANRKTGLCRNGNIPLNEPLRLSETEVELETPPPDRSCHGRIWKINTATQVFEMYEYDNNDRTVLRRVKDPFDVQFK